MRNTIKSGLFGTAVAVLAALLLSGATAQAQIDLGEFEQYLENIQSMPIELNLLDKELLAKAEPDECFYGIGDPDNGPLPCQYPGGQEKTNQGYVWGMAKTGYYIWFGTWTNGQCNTLDVENAFLGGPTLVDGSYVCEYGANDPDRDWRRPKIYMYNTITGVATEKNPQLPQYALDLLDDCWGIRSAGIAKGVAFLAGPAIPDEDANDDDYIKVFAFDAATGAFLKAGEMEGYGEVRRWLTVGDDLYFGAGIGQGGIAGGVVMKWDGDLDAIRNPSVPIVDHFEPASSILPALPAYLAYHKGSLVAGTWGAGIWMAPPDGSTEWIQIFDFAEYDPDPVVARTTLAGAMISYQGYLYFSTMHILGVAPILALAPPELGGYGIQVQNEDDYFNLFYATLRSVSIYRAKNLGTIFQRVELLYGERELPAYDPVAQEWNMEPTGQGQPLFGTSRVGWPRYGHSGFGNFFNTYTWSASVYRNRLYFGTFDWSFTLDSYYESNAEATAALAADASAAARSIIDPEVANQIRTQNARAIEIGTAEILKLLGSLVLNGPGGDLWVFPNRFMRAYAETVTGGGNDRNYGFRTQVSDANALYVGTANPFNLDPDGGWELIKMTRGGFFR